MTVKGTELVNGSKTSPIICPLVKESFAMLYFGVRVYGGGRSCSSYHLLKLSGLPMWLEQITRFFELFIESWKMLN